MTIKGPVGIISKPAVSFVGTNSKLSNNSYLSPLLPNNNSALGNCLYFDSYENYTAI